MAKIIERFKSAWNVFLNKDPTPNYLYSGYSFRPDKMRMTTNNIRSTIKSIYNKIAVDCSSIDIRHVRLDENGIYKETIKSDLNYALTKEANLDQTGRELISDTVMSMFDEGYVAIVPILTDRDPKTTESYKIYTMRVGKILEWWPNRVRIECYNDITGFQESRIFDKRVVTIIENPFYSVMNEQDSIAKRLQRVLKQLDKINENNSSGKLDLIIQLPYQTKSGIKKLQAKERANEIENQLSNSPHGIAFVDATEKVIQLNRAIENNLWEQAKDLQIQLLNELGFTESIFNGTADEQTMLNYYNRTIEPILTTICENMSRKWLTKTAITQGQDIRFYRNAFKLVPVQQLAEIADKFTRNEIMTSNEVRSVIGMKPSDDPKADELRNANLNHPDENISEEREKRY